MQDADVGIVLRDMLVVVLKLGGPALLGALVIGLVISLFQAVTQISEPTLSFVPKVVVLGGLLALFGPFMLATLRDFAHGLFDRLIAIGGS